MVIIRTMPTGEQRTSLTTLLRKALSQAESIRGVAKATGLDHASLVRFNNGKGSLRLDKADKLAEHFGIESRHVRRQKD